MNVIKNSMSYVIKIFINHFVSGIYSLVLFMVLSIAFEGKFVALSSVVSIAFYLYLVYSFMWESGAKRGVSFDNVNIKKWDGLLIMAAGSLPFYASTILCAILEIFKSDSAFAERTVDVLYNFLFYFNVLFSQAMYSGLFTVWFGSIPNTSALFYLISILPGLVVGGCAYLLGSKNIRIRSFFGIKYNEEKEKIKNNY